MDPFALPPGSGAGTPTYDEPSKFEFDKDSAQIPSSNTPSPLKIPGDTVSKQTHSPIKVPNEVTKALQDTITNLLGKRPSGEVSYPTRMGKKGKLPVKPQVNMNLSKKTWYFTSFAVVVTS
jgi:DNA replication regulator DPB11